MEEAEISVRVDGSEQAAQQLQNLSDVLDRLSGGGVGGSIAGTGPIGGIPSMGGGVSSDPYAGYGTLGAPTASTTIPTMGGSAFGNMDPTAAGGPLYNPSAHGRANMLPAGHLAPEAPGVSRVAEPGANYGAPSTPLPNPSDSGGGWSPVSGSAPDWFHPSMQGGNGVNVVQMIQQMMSGGAGSGGIGGMLGQSALNHPLVSNLLGGVQQLAPMLGGEALGGITSMVATALPYVGAFLAAEKVASAGYEFFASGQMPRYNLETQLMIAAKKGQYIDPAIIAAQKQAADDEGGIRKWDNLRQSWAGRAVNFASMGFLDDLWNYQWKPEMERHRDLNAAEGDNVVLTRRFYGRTGLSPDIDPYSNERFDLLQRNGAYGFSQRNFVRSMDYGQYGKFAQPDEVNASISASYSVSDQQGFEALAYRRLKGEDPRNFAPDAAQSAIWSGDQSTLDALRPEYQRRYGIGGGLVSQQNDLRTLIDVRALRTQGSILESELGGRQSRMSRAAARGAGGFDLANQQEANANSLDGIIANLQQLRAYAPNDMARAQIDAQIAGLDAQKEQGITAATMQRFSTRQTINEATMGRAQMNLTSAMYGNSEGDVLAGYGSEAYALREQRGIYSDMSQSSRISPEQRALYAMQVRQIDQQLKYQLPRERGQFQEGLREGEIGVSRAGYEYRSAQANLFGGAADMYSARIAATNSTRAELGVIGQELSGQYGPRTMQERLELERKQIDLTRELNVEIEQSKRSFLQMGVAVAQTGAQIIGTQGQRAYLLGAGGSGAAGIDAANIRASDNIVAKSKAVADYYDKTTAADNPDRMAADAAYQGALTSREQTRLSMADRPMPIDLRMAERESQTRFSVAMKTMLPYGNMRGYYEEQMGYVGQELKEIGSIRTQAKQNGWYDKALEEKLRGRELGLVDNAAGLQQQLETGWMDRLISSQYNAPAGMRLATAANFTQHEAASFLQNVSPVFGFTDAGKRDGFMFQGSRLANNLLGVMQRPDGYLDTALAGFSPVRAPGGGSGGGSDLRDIVRQVLGGSGGGGNNGTMTIHVIVSDSSGKVIGQTTKTSRDIASGATTVNVSPYTQGGSRQM